MALGNILKETREARGLTTTEVAEHTNMMVQIVEELEKEDFHRIAAPIYGRGFLKLYAELLQIDAQPLIEEFMDIYNGKVIPAMLQKKVEAPEAPKIPVARTMEQEASDAVAEHSGSRLHEAAPNVEVAPQMPAAESMPELDAAPELDTAPATAPERAPVVPHPGVRKLNTDPITVDAPLPRPVTEDEIASLFDEQAEAAQVAISEQQTEDEVTAPRQVSSSAVPPSAGDDDLFGDDEPNLFNTTPLQERIAEAKRLMEEKENAENEEIKQKKSASLHLSPNQRLPVFQIGGRMEKVYEAERRKRKSPFKIRVRFSNGMLRSIGYFLNKIKLRVPFEAGSHINKALLAYSALALLVLVFVVSGVKAIYNLTRSEKATVAESRSATEIMPEKSVEPVVGALSKSVESRRIPPPPDIYFD